MKLIECVNAYVAAEILMKRDMDFKSAYALAKLKRRLAPHAVFYSREEMKLVREYAKKDERGEPVFVKEGEFAFEDSENAAKYREKLGELASMEIDETIEPVTVRAPERITPEVIYGLEGLVRFEEGTA